MGVIDVVSQMDPVIPAVFRKYRVIFFSLNFPLIFEKSRSKEVCSCVTVTAVAELLPQFTLVEHFLVA